MKNRIIMGIYPNTKGFGYAIFTSATKPIMCGMVRINPASNIECMKRITKLVDHFQPTAIILQNNDTKRPCKRKRVSKLLNTIESEYVQNGIEITTFSRLEIKEVFQLFNAQTKFEIANVIAKWLPIYMDKLPKYRKAWMAESYWQGMFDAMSLVLTFYYLEK